jgi:formate hydrogenlyase transcriptional activator
LHGQSTISILGNATGSRAHDTGSALDLYERRSDGTEFPIEMRLSSFMADGKTLVLKPVRDISDLKRAPESRSRLEFESVMCRLSKTFVNLSVHRIDGEINQGLRAVAEVLDLDRIAIVLTELKLHRGIVTHWWVREGVPPARFRNVSERFPWLAGRVAGGNTVCVSAPEDLPDEAIAERRHMLSTGMKSWLTVPLQVGGEGLGRMGTTIFRRRQVWDALLIARFRQASEIFANALSRARADENLRDAYREIEQLKGHLGKENVYLREEVKLEHHHHEVIGDSEGIRRVLRKAEQVAATDATVLLLGETGTGKELIARTIHDTSLRKGRIMVKVNCAALPASLVESELFGREKGAFTGALTREIGRFELANGSTILLDEIAELPLELQSKLLRILQEGEFERLGNPRTIKVDVRVIAATSRNLQEAVRAGKFREDLFYRLNVFPITIPPLRERREDIPALVWHFVSELGQRMGRSIETIQASTMEAFKTYYWPGNIRELRNVIERFLITSANTTFRADLRVLENPVAGALTDTFEEVERKHILHVLELAGWRVRGVGGAAQILNLKPTTLESRMQKLGIVRVK